MLPFALNMWATGATILWRRRVGRSTTWSARLIKNFTYDDFPESSQMWKFFRRVFAFLLKYCPPEGISGWKSTLPFSNRSRSSISDWFCYCIAVNYRSCSVANLKEPHQLNQMNIWSLQSRGRDLESLNSSIPLLLGKDSLHRVKRLMFLRSEFPAI